MTCDAYFLKLLCPDTLAGSSVNSQKVPIISLVENKAAKMRNWPWRTIVWKNMAAKSIILQNEEPGL